MLVDELALFQGQVASGRGSVGADLSRGCRAAVAASSWLAGDVARGCLVCSGEWMRTGVAPQVSKGQGPDAATRAHAHAKRALWARPEHARDVLDKMPGHARGLG